MNLFRWLYYIANFFIFIGDVTKKIVTVPIYFLGSLIVKSFLFIYRGIKRIKLPTFKLPAFTLPRIIPKIRLPKINQRLIFEKIKYFFLGCFITLIIVSIFQSYYFIKDLPSPYNIGKINYSLSTHIYDRNNNLLYEIYREQNRTPIVLKELPAYVAQATIAIEDKDFYKHYGISLGIPEYQVDFHPIVKINDR